MKKKITLLGVEGCPTCTLLDARVKTAIESLDTDITVEKITEPERIMEYNAGGLPAVFVDGQSKAVRRVPEVQELIAWLQ
jgi:predicted DsbA family dithiol-disulfide isomerase